MEEIVNMKDRLCAFMAVSELANSHRKCNGPIPEDFGGRQVVEALPRSVIQGPYIRGKMLVCQVGERFVFGQVLLQKAVGVFVGAAFPGAVGVSEVDGEFQAAAEVFVEG